MKLTPLGKLFLVLVILGVGGFIAFKRYGTEIKGWAGAGQPSGKTGGGEVTKDDFASATGKDGVTKTDFQGEYKDHPRGEVAVGTKSAGIADQKLNRPLVVGINTWAGHAPGIVANGGMDPGSPASLYKKKYTVDAIEELRLHAGTQFDPELVTVFCDLFASLAPEPDQTILAINAMHSHRRVPAQLVAADGLTPAVSGPRVARRDRAAASSGMTDATARPPKSDRSQIRIAGDSGRQGPGPSAIREETSTAAAEAQGRMELTETASGPPPQAPDVSGSPSSDHPRGIVSG